MQIGTPNFTNGQFVDAPMLNTAFGVVSGAIAGTDVYVWPQAGLLYPEALTAVGTSALVVSGVLAVPFGLLTSSGAIATAQGSTAGSTTTHFSVNFAPLVPSGGTLTAYLLAQGSTVLENAIGVPGPPPGHPSYNPNFVPTTAYQLIANTLTITASSTPPDGVTTFEIARTLLTVGQSSFTSGAFDYSNQHRAPIYAGLPSFAVTGSYQLPVNASPFMTVSDGVSGYISTLPPAALAAGVPYRFVNPGSSFPLTLVPAGTDKIYGVQASGVSSTVIPPLSALALWSNGTGWFATAFSPSLAPAYNKLVTFTSGAGIWLVPNEATVVKVTQSGPGAGGGGSDATGTYPGAGGGGGASLIAYLPVTPGASISWGVGAGGTGGVAGSPGASGSGTTVFGSLIASGGLGGAVGSSTGSIGGAGGASGVYANADATAGQQGRTIANGVTAQSGDGGANGLGQPGAFGSFISNGQNATSPGGGGSGGAPAVGGTHGGNGANGKITVEYG